MTVWLYLIELKTQSELSSPLTEASISDINRFARPMEQRVLQFPHYTFEAETPGSSVSLLLLCCVLMC